MYNPSAVFFTGSANGTGNASLLAPMNRKSSYWAGKQVEEQALAFFRNQPGYTLLSKNFRSYRGELDLIFEEKNHLSQVELVFIEVRFRSTKSWESATESITFQKRLRIKRAADRFLSQYNGKAQSIRFDLLCKENQKWNYIKNAWTY